MYNILILSGVSGSGKTTISHILKTKYNFKTSISYTTREIRHDEINHINYKFISKKDFEEKLKDNFFLEYTEKFGNYYGTAKEDISQLIKSNNVVMTLCHKGYLSIKEQWPNSVGVYLMPPSAEQLKKRMNNRKQTENELSVRLENVIEQAHQEKKHFEHIIQPNSLSSTIEQIMQIFNYTN